MKKIFIVTSALLVVIIASCYVYLLYKNPLSITTGHDPNSDEVMIDLSNTSIFPLTVDSIKFRNDEDTVSFGETFQYQLKFQLIGITSKDLSSANFTNRVVFFEPFNKLLLRSNDHKCSKGLIVKNIDSTDLSEMKEIQVGIKVMGFLPFYVSQDIDFYNDGIADFETN